VLGDRSTLGLRAGVAFVWLATGVLVLHPTYREIGLAELARVPGLAGAGWLMWATCAFEIALGVTVLLARAATWLTVLQVGMIATFTLILSVADPMLLVSPFGVLTKNVPIVSCLGVAWLVERRGWSERALWMLRVGVGVIWFTEGLMPKWLFQQPIELAIAARTVPFLAPSTALHVIGTVQIAGGVLALTLRGAPLRLVLLAQAAALVVLAGVMTFVDASLWAHPFGPLTKNAPILMGTLVARARLASGKKEGA